MSSKTPLAAFWAAFGWGGYLYLSLTDLDAIGDLPRMERLMTGGITLGVLPAFPYHDDGTDVRPGDTLVVFTDGITDAINDAQELFGVERLERVVREHLGSSVEEIAQAVIDAVDAHAQGEAQFDDLTLMVLKRL